MTAATIGILALGFIAIALWGIAFGTIYRDR